MTTPTKTKPNNFEKKPVAILYGHEIIYIAPSIRICAEIFKETPDTIRKLIDSGDIIHGYCLKLAKKNDVVPSASKVSDINDGLKRFKKALEQYNEDKACLTTMLQHKSRIKLQPNVKKRENVKKQSNNIYQSLLALWKYKYLREPNQKELLVLKGVSTIMLQEFHTSQLCDHISAHSPSYLDEGFVERILSYLEPIVRQKVNKTKHKSLRLKSYYILSEEVAILCHYLHSSRVETLFIAQKEIAPLIERIKRKYGCDILGVEFNFYLAD